jgi:hypothetical protein
MSNPERSQRYRNHGNQGPEKYTRADVERVKQALLSIDPGKATAALVGKRAFPSMEWRYAKKHANQILYSLQRVTSDVTKDDREGDGPPIWFWTGDTYEEEKEKKGKEVEDEDDWDEEESNDEYFVAFPPLKNTNRNRKQLQKKKSPPRRKHVRVAIVDLDQKSHIAGKIATSYNGTSDRIYACHSLHYAGYNMRNHPRCIVEQCMEESFSLSSEAVMRLYTRIIEDITSGELRAVSVKSIDIYSSNALFRTIQKILEGKGFTVNVIIV